MTTDFEPHTETITVIYDAKGGEIAKLDGRVEVRPKDYEQYLPVEYRHISITTEVLSVVKIEKKGSDE